MKTQPAYVQSRMGLTIVEVLIALVIVGVVTAATVPILISTIRNSSDNRVRAQAVAATEAWLDRFRSKSLDFAHFQGEMTYPYGYDFGADPVFVAAADPDPAALNAEWEDYSFSVTTEVFASSPLLWRVIVETRYESAFGQEGTLDVSTIIEQ